MSSLHPSIIDPVLVERFVKLQEAVRKADKDLTTAETEYRIEQEKLEGILKELGVKSLQEAEAKFEKAAPLLEKAASEIEAKAKELGLL